MTVVARAILAAGLVAVSVSSAVRAHHSVTANFDMSRQVEISGEVVEWRFKNPHSFLVVSGTEVVDGVASGETVRWEIESSASAGLRAQGVDETSFSPGDRVVIRGNPHRNGALHRVNAFGNPGSFMRADGTPIGRGGFLPEDIPPVVVTAPQAEGAQRLAGLWRPPFQPNPPTTPLALTDAGRAAWDAYDQKLSPANTCEPMSIPDVFNAPSYVVTIEIGEDHAVVRNQAYTVERTVPLDGSAAPADPAGLFGVVSGRIEDDGLIIESRDYPASAWGLGAATQIMGAGADAPSSEQKSVIERFSTSADGLTLIYEYTVEDPVYLTEAFSHRFEMARLPDDTPVFPYDCDVESAAQFSRD
jgi:hypothetical protein